MMPDIAVNDSHNRVPRYALELDLLFNKKTCSVLQYGEDRVYYAIQAAIDAYNKEYRAYNENFCQYTDDQYRVYGNKIRLVMEQGSEYSQPDAQRQIPQLRMGLPLERSDYELNFSRKVMENTTPHDFAELILNKLEEDRLNLMGRYQQAVFNPRGNPAFIDYLYDYRTLFLYPLLNGDKNPIPMSHEGQYFSPLHSHYSASLELDEECVETAYNNVCEHGVEGRIDLLINKDQFNFINSLVEFVPTLLAKPLPKTGVDRDYYIGSWRNAHVYVTEWVPNDRFVVVDTGYDSATRPLALRTQPGNINADLILAADFEDFPLRAPYLIRDDGIGVLNRHGMTVHQFGSKYYTWED